MRGTVMLNYYKLKEIREAHDMIQKDAAKLLNVEATTLSNYERGTRKPPHEFLLSFCEIFNIPKEELNAIFYEEKVHDTLDPYASIKETNQAFIILEPEKLMELSYTERLMIKKYAEYIYNTHKKSKNKR